MGQGGFPLSPRPGSEKSTCAAHWSGEVCLRAAPVRSAQAPARSPGPAHSAQPRIGDRKGTVEWSGYWAVGPGAHPMPSVHTPTPPHRPVGNETSSQHLPQAQAIPAAPGLWWPHCPRAYVKPLPGNTGSPLRSRQEWSPQCTHLHSQGPPFLKPRRSSPAPWEAHPHFQPKVKTHFLASCFGSGD